MINGGASLDFGSCYLSSFVEVDDKSSGPEVSYDTLFRESLDSRLSSESAKSRYFFDIRVRTSKNQRIK